MGSTIGKYSPLRECFIDKDIIITKPEHTKKKIVILITNQTLIEAAGGLEGPAIDQARRGKNEHIGRQATDEGPLRMLDLRHLIKAATGHQPSLPIDLVDVAINPPDLRIPGFPKRPNEFFQVVRVPHVVLVQQRDQRCR